MGMLRDILPIYGFRVYEMREITYAKGGSMKSDKELFELWHRQKFGHFQRDADHFSLIEAAFLHALAKGREMEREKILEIVEAESAAGITFKLPHFAMCANKIAAAIRDREGKK